jgi:hypothetical protein
MGLGHYNASKCLFTLLQFSTKVNIISIKASEFVCQNDRNICKEHDIIPMVFLIKNAQFEYKDREI